MKKQLSQALVVVLLAGSAATVLCDGARQGLVAQGTPAPEFDFQALDGGRVTSGALKGQVVLLNFWATWCGPCREEMPWLVALADELSNQGLVFVAVSQDDAEEREEAVRRYSRSVPGLERFAVYGDPFTAGRFKVQALPSLVVIGRDGTVKQSVRGQVSERRVRRWLKQAMEEP